jgi:hypothetical protein
MRRILRAGGWTAVVAAVVLAARTLAYALAPDPRAVALGQVTGGPRPVVAGAVALVLAATVAGAVLWLSALGVRERHRLRAGGATPRLRLVPVLARSLAVAVVSAAAFTAIESIIHEREGLGFHGLHCLAGPVHENALPLIAALSLLAVALVEAVRHAVEFGRRVIAARPPRSRVPRAARHARVAALVLELLAVERPTVLRGRGPPAPLCFS